MMKKMSKSCFGKNSERKFAMDCLSWNLPFLVNLKESIKYGKRAYDKASIKNWSDGRKVTLKTSLLLSEVYDQLGQPMEGYKYLKTYAKLKKGIEEEDAANSLSNVEIQEVIGKSQTAERTGKSKSALVVNQGLLVLCLQRSL
jgi:hypothetical protein